MKTQTMMKSMIQRWVGWEAVSECRSISQSSVSSYTRVPSVTVVAGSGSHPWSDLHLGVGAMVGAVDKGSILTEGGSWW